MQALELDSKREAVENYILPRKGNSRAASSRSRR